MACDPKVLTVERGRKRKNANTEGSEVRAIAGPELAHGSVAVIGHPDVGSVKRYAVREMPHIIRANQRAIARLEFGNIVAVGVSDPDIGTIEGGRATNVIADKAEAHLLIRLVGPSEETRSAIQQAVAGLAAVDFTLEIPFKRLRHLEGLPTMVAAFTTDVPWLTNWGEPLLLGPGSIHVAHTPHEKLSKRELAEAIDLYVQVAQRLVNGEA